VYGSRASIAPLSTDSIATMRKLPGRGADPSLSESA
jgi:hypothetical protein